MEVEVEVDVGVEVSMSTVVVLGIGLQGRAVVHDLVRVQQVQHVVAADLDAETVRAALPADVAARVTTVGVDAGDEAQLTALLADHRPDAVICMLPPALGPSVARLSLEAGAHYVCTSYTGLLADLHDLALGRGLAVLPEMGLDPGIDLVLAQLAVSHLDEVHGLDVFGGGLPAPDCADANPLRYKVSWTLQGVLDAYVRPARVLAGGVERSIDGTGIFHPDLVRHEEVDGVGRLEVYPNGDAISFIETFGLGPALQEMGRYSLRWPGHCAFWHDLVRLGLLDGEPAVAGGLAPRQLLARMLEPRLQFGDDEQDVVVLRIRAWGLRDGAAREETYDVVDYRDLDTGLFAMNRTVGFTAAMAAQLLLDGSVAERGVVSPARDVPPDRFVAELKRRGIRVNRGQRAI